MGSMLIDLWKSGKKLMHWLLGKRLKFKVRELFVSMPKWLAPQFQIDLIGAVVKWPWKY